MRATTAAVILGRRLRRDEGQALTEYALIVFFIAIVSVGVLWALGVDVASALDLVEAGIDGDDPNGPAPLADPQP